MTYPSWSVMRYEPLVSNFWDINFLRRELPRWKNHLGAILALYLGGSQGASFSTGQVYLRLPRPSPSPRDSREYLTTIFRALTHSLSWSSVTIFQISFYKNCSFGSSGTAIVLEAYLPYAWCELFPTREWYLGQPVHGLETSIQLTSMQSANKGSQTQAQFKKLAQIEHMSNILMREWRPHFAEFHYRDVSFSWVDCWIHKPNLYLPEIPLPKILHGERLSVDMEDLFRTPLLMSTLEWRVRLVVVEL